MKKKQSTDEGKDGGRRDATRRDATDRELTEDAIIRPHARVHESAPVRDLLDLPHVPGIDEGAAELLVRGDDYPVDRGDAQCRPAVRDGIQCVFDLQELPGTREGSQGEGVGGVTHDVYAVVYIILYIVLLTWYCGGSGIKLLRTKAGIAEGWCACL